MKAAIGKKVYYPAWKKERQSNQSCIILTYLYETNSFYLLLKKWTDL